LPATLRASASILSAYLTTAVAVAAHCLNAPAEATNQKTWDKTACNYFTHVKDAHICTLVSIYKFAPLVLEPAELIAEQSLKRCSWDYEFIYDRDQGRLTLYIHLVSING
jgi:hypothetical protein